MNIRQLKAANPIERVAARYGTLHRAGANFKMLCPFHDDHHPSLHIHVGGQYFKCHACGAGGDVVDLVKGFEHCSFAEAIHIIDNGQLTIDNEGKAKAAIKPASPLRVTSAALHLPTDNRQLSILNAQFKASLLPVASGHGELSPTWLDFEVGLAPAFVPEAFKAMRGRLVFPIYDAAGTLTGFGARRVDAAGEAPEGSPKYLNTPNNGLFDKGRMLYGIHRAAGAIGREGYAYLVEGYKDVLAMHAAGFTHTVGLGGTAFTEGQAEVLRGFCGRAVLLLDNDAAGRAATARLLQGPPGGMELDSLCLSAAKDPDELFRRLGRDGFVRYMALLAGRVGAGEKRLLAFCLKYPEVAGHVERMLEDDDMPLSSEVYRNLLHFTALGQAADVLPEEEGWLREMLAGVIPDLPLPAGVPGELLGKAEEEICRDLAEYFRLEYYEERVLAETARLAERVRTAGSPHAELLERLSRHIAVQVELTTALARTPVLDERWLLK